MGGGGRGGGGGGHSARPESCALTILRVFSILKSQSTWHQPTNIRSYQPRMRMYVRLLAHRRACHATHAHNHSRVCGLCVDMAVFFTSPSVTLAGLCFDRQPSWYGGNVTRCGTIISEANPLIHRHSHTGLGRWIAQSCSIDRRVKAQPEQAAHRCLLPMEETQLPR